MAIEENTMLSTNLPLSSPELADGLYSSSELINSSRGSAESRSSGVVCVWNYVKFVKFQLFKLI